MSRYLVQYVQRRNPREWSFDAVGVLVREGKDLIPVAVAGGDATWEREMREALGFWDGTPREKMLLLLDQNGTNTAYSVPSEITADSPRDAAEKLHARITRGFAR